MNFNKDSKKLFRGVIVTFLIIPVFIIFFCVLIYTLDVSYDVVKKVIEAALNGDWDSAKYKLMHSKNYLYVFTALGLIIFIQFFKSLFDVTIKKYLDKKATDFYKFIERKTN